MYLICLPRLGALVCLYHLLTTAFLSYWQVTYSVMKNKLLCARSRWKYPSNSPPLPASPKNWKKKWPPVTTSPWVRLTQDSPLSVPFSMKFHLRIQPFPHCYPCLGPVRHKQQRSQRPPVGRNQWESCGRGKNKKRAPKSILQSWFVVFIANVAMSTMAHGMPAKCQHRVAG